MGILYIANGESLFAPIAAEALRSKFQKIVVAYPANGDGAGRDRLRAISGVEVVEADCSQDAGWQVLADLPEAKAASVDAIVHCPPDAAEAEVHIRSAWLAAKHANEFTRNGQQILLVLAPGEGGDMVERESTIGGLRIAMPGALLDAMKQGMALRTNRLIVDDGADELDVASAISVLCDRRSTFITGEEVRISARRNGIGGHEIGLEGKAILVTGATSPIGKAIAIEIGRLGGWVGVCARKMTEAQDVLEQVRDAGGDGTVLPLDIREPSDWARAVQAAVDARGALHGLVNNAGDARYGPIGQMASADVDHVIGINYRASLSGMKAAAGAIAQGPGGCIINVASVAGLRSGYDNTVYGGSRGAMIAMTQAFARCPDHPSNVRVNSVQAGLIWSENVVNTLGEEGAAAFRAMIEPKTPAGRVGTPEEIAKPVAYLLSDAAAAITGQAITVSGGLELCYP